MTIAVHNVGTPIPPELLGNLFEPMIRGSHDNAELRSVGLGLFIVREIARANTQVGQFMPWEDQP
ncbi:MAG: ATP-binding protein [Pseudomonas chlororaphis]